MSTALTQLLEILQAHGLMERSDERFLSAPDARRAQRASGAHRDGGRERVQARVIWVEPAAAERGGRHP